MRNFTEQDLPVNENLYNYFLHFNSYDGTWNAFDRSEAEIYMTYPDRMKTLLKAGNWFDLFAQIGKQKIVSQEYTFKK